MKSYEVTQFYCRHLEFQHIKAESKEEAIRIARDELEADDAVNDDFHEQWFADEETDEDAEDLVYLPGDIREDWRKMAAHLSSRMTREEFVKRAGDAYDIAKKRQVIGLELTKEML